MAAKIDKGASFTMAAGWSTQLRIRLGPKDAEDLRFLWGAYEASCSLRAINYGNMGSARGSGGGCYSPLDDLDPWSGARRKEVRMAARARATLAKLLPAEVVVLFKLYGPSRPVPALAVFGNLAPVLSCVPSVVRLAEARRTTVIDAVSRRLVEPSAVEFIRSTKAASERVVDSACRAYIAAKEKGQ